ncbi:hypothetical protein CCHR01_08880 [Colletotrichum chrysophilum]|uniref:Uncharacterized protein n=1 Tax=Colletotrichum chrysophilum TaxID=1836956 RepID=A0AAD9EEN8_9PEZI|nr:hypothetical protein CCHR01_08880 [Colletotrichum chrysophilum]
MSRKHGTAQRSQLHEQYLAQTVHGMIVGNVTAGKSAASMSPTRQQPGQISSRQILSEAKSSLDLPSFRAVVVAQVHLHPETTSTQGIRTTSPCTGVAAIGSAAQGNVAVLSPNTLDDAVCGRPDAWTEPC